MINNVPSAPFSMNFVAPMGEPNPQLNDALKRLSAAKYGKPRAQVEKEIFDRLRAADVAKQNRLEQMRSMQQNRMNGGTAPVGQGAAAAPGGKPGSSFLDDWLAKRQQLGGQQSGTRPTTPPATVPNPVTPPPLNAKADELAPSPLPIQPKPVEPRVTPGTEQESINTDKFHLRGDNKNDDGEVAVKLR